MDTVDLGALNFLTTKLGDLGLTLLGLALSIWAMCKADGAKRAVAKVLTKNSDQAARDNARDLLAKLKRAKDGAMARRQHAPRSAIAGRVPTAAEDLAALQQAQDALATSTLGHGQQLALDLKRAADQLNSNLQKLAENSDRDEWADALGVIQGIVPKLELLQTELGAKALR